MATASMTGTKTIDHFINGEFVPSSSGEYFEDLNPASGECIARVAAGNAKDVDDAVAAAKHAVERGPWAKMSVRDRANIVKKIGDLILQNRRELAIAESNDTGKPISESFDGDIPRAAQNFHFFAEYAVSIAEECYSPAHNERHLVVREPSGVAGLITPWNLPLYLETWKIAPCLMTGSSCVLKPAEWTPHTAFLLAAITKEAGLPDGVFNIVNGFGPAAAGEALTRHPDVRSISFTGETGTGKAIMAAAASTLKKVSFELGGKGATIIFEDADLDEALPVAVRAAFRNQGEICLAGSRLFVHEKIYKKVVEELSRRIQAIKVGNPLEETTQMGAIISKEQMDKVQHYIEIGKSEGKLVTGGVRLKEFPNGNFLSPALITDISEESRVCREEIFGPVLPVIPFSSEEEAVAMANATPYGLSCSVWSNDSSRLHRTTRDIKCGIVWANCWFARDLRTPFGGQKASGIGREGGKWALDFFSELKTISYRYKD